VYLGPVIRAGAEKHPKTRQEVSIGNPVHRRCKAMEHAVVTLDQRTVRAHVCELCVQIMKRNMEAPDQVIGICPDCHRDIPE